MTKLLTRMAVAACLIFSHAVFAQSTETKIEKDRVGYVTVNLGSEILTLIKTDGNFIGIEDYAFYAFFPEENEKILIANVDVSNSDDRMTTSLENLKVRVVTDRIKRVFKTKKCGGHGVCLPFPHFAKERELAIEIETIHNEIICYRHFGIGFSSGKCGK